MIVFRSVSSDEGYGTASPVEDDYALSMDKFDDDGETGAELDGSVEEYSGDFDALGLSSDDEKEEGLGEEEVDKFDDEKPTNNATSRKASAVVSPGKAQSSKVQRKESVTDDDSVNSDDLLAYLSESDEGSSRANSASPSSSGRKVYGERRQSVKERVDAILSPRVKTHAEVKRAEEDRSAARKLSVLDTDVGNFRAALIDALSTKQPKPSPVRRSPPKLPPPERPAVVVKKNLFHSNLLHNEQVVRKQLATALKKLQVQGRENEVLLHRLDQSESLESFERLRQQLEERDRTIERLEIDNKYLQLVQRNQGKILVENSRDMHEEIDPETAALAEVKVLTGRLSSMRASLEESRGKEKITNRKYELFRKKYRKLNKKYSKLKTEHSIVTSAEGGSLFTITEASGESGMSMAAGLDGDSAFAASVDDMQPSILEEEKSKWELEMKSVRRSAASQKSVYLSELALLKGDLQKNEALRKEACDELVVREKQARVQLALVKKLRMTCEDLKTKNKLLQEASDLYSKKGEEPRTPAMVTQPLKPSLPTNTTAPLKPINSARRLVTPKQALMCPDEEDFKDGTFLTNS